MEATKRSIETRSLGRRLARARERLQWTQRQLADLAQLTHQTVGVIERGATDPRLSTLVQLAAALGVRPEWLAFGLGEGP